VKIPIQNVYYLLCYAWDRMDEGEVVDLGEVEGLTLADLFAKVLAEGVGRLLRRGLGRDYLEVSDDIAGIRGKLDVSATLKRGLMARAKTHCHYDELDYDVLHNQIIKATLRNLLWLADLDRGLRGKVERLYRKLDAVSDIPLSRQQFRSVRIHRNNGFYLFLISICHLIHENLLVDEESGAAKFRDFRRDRVLMSALFEDFARNFYRREQAVFKVSAPHIPWCDVEASDHDMAYLPVMRSDVVLQAPDRCIVLDMKYYGEALKGHHGGHRKIDSGNLYQILTYVQNRAADAGERVPHEGMLLYPVVADQFHFRYRLLGRTIRVCSIDLDQPWQGIHRDMLRLLEPVAA